MAHKVNASVEGHGNEVNIYADAETLRAIADEMDEKGSVFIAGHDVQIDEPLTIMFGSYFEEGD